MIEEITRRITKFTKKDNHYLVGIIMISIITRVVVAIILGDTVISLPGTDDQVSYQALALRVLSGHGFSFGKNWWPVTAANEPTAHWSYLYTLYLVIVYSLFGPHPLIARLIQTILVGIFQPLLTYTITRRLFGSTVGLVAAAISAFYGYFIYYAGTLMTEPFYFCGILLSLFTAILIVDHLTRVGKSKWEFRDYRLVLIFGLALGFTVLLRQLFMLVIPFIFLWMWLVNRLRKGGSLIPVFAASVGVLIIMVIPFTIYNYARFERFVLLNTNAGYALFWANHPVHGTHFIPARDDLDYISLIPSELRSLDEAALEQELLKRGIQFVIDNPGRYLLLSLDRASEYFMFWPHEDSVFISNFTRVVSFGLTAPFMLLGIVIWFKDRLKNGFAVMLSGSGTLLLVFAVIYSTIHLLSWALVRYRLPVDAVLVIFAGYGIVEIYRHFMERVLKPRKSAPEL